VKKVFVLLLLLFAGAAYGAELIARQGNDFVRAFTHIACPKEIADTLPNMPKMGDFFYGEVQFNGVDYKVCWRMMGNAILLHYPDGDQGIVPLTELKPVLNVNAN
jgi:hypothetical protein